LRLLSHPARYFFYFASVTRRTPLLLQHIDYKLIKMVLLAAKSTFVLERTRVQGVCFTRFGYQTSCNCLGKLPWSPDMTVLAETRHKSRRTTSFIFYYHNMTNLKHDIYFFKQEDKKTYHCKRWSNLNIDYYKRHAHCRTRVSQKC